MWRMHVETTGVEWPCDFGASHIKRSTITVCSIIAVQSKASPVKSSTVAHRHMETTLCHSEPLEPGTAPSDNDE